MLALLSSERLAGEERFPPPDFTSGHKLPITTVPAPRADFWQWADLVLLVGALSAASTLALKSRSRRGLFYLTVFSLVYFGFWRQGCVCPIGSIQNVTLALFDSSYVVPLGVTAFFLIPIAFALAFGRTFCAAVCPLGAIQDLVLLQPVRVPAWLETGLRVFPYVYLGAGVLFAATSSAFIICEYDPFVAFFRLSGGSGMLLLGAALLVLGMAVGRPYCRFLCPYGAILGIVSRFSRWSVTITPDVCTRCKLCEDVCPFGAIESPAPAGEPATEPAGRSSGPRWGLALLGLLPVLVLAGGLLGAGASGLMSRMHAKVRLAERIALEDASAVDGKTDASTAFRATGAPLAALHADVRAVKERYAFGSSILGAFIGFVLGVKLIQAVAPRRREDYEIRRSRCIACGRCFRYCPKEHDRLKDIGVEVPPSAVTGQL